MGVSAKERLTRGGAVDLPSLQHSRTATGASGYGWTRNSHQRKITDLKLMLQHMEFAHCQSFVLVYGY